MLLRFQCKTCLNQIDKIIEKAEDIRGVIPCLSCGGFLERQLSGPSSNAVETVDTGFMTQSVEYDSTKNSYRKEASEKHYRDLFKKEDLK